VSSGNYIRRYNNECGKEKKNQRRSEGEKISKNAGVNMSDCNEDGEVIFLGGNIPLYIKVSDP